MLNRRFQLTALKVASLCLAVTAVTVYAIDAPDHASAVHERQATGPGAPKAPRVAVIRATEVWAADESATGLRPDAAH